MKLTAILYFPLLLISGIALGQPKADKPIIQTTTKGKIEGFINDASGVQYFLGIPYAQAPVGELRWKAPKALESWTGIKGAKEFRKGPVQAAIFGDMKFRSGGFDEDCLYLNVWKPNRKEKSLLPVLVYFHGGGFVAGDGSEPRYDGESMSKKGIIVITVNYRLNIFGFLSHPELSAESPTKSSGNYGLLDQVEALKWVKENIGLFGGDPNQVTIAGESAGSISVSLHMASPLSKNLFARAIGESGAAINPTMAPTKLEEAEKIGKGFLQKSNIPSIAQLRAMTTEEVFKHFTSSGMFGFPTVIDGHFLLNSLPETFQAGQQANIPLLAGWNSSEIPAIAFMRGKAYTEENFIQRLKEDYPNHYQELLQWYPHKTTEEMEWSATDLASDKFIVYSTWKWMDMHQQTSKQKVYRYIYAHKRPPLVDTSLASGLAGGTAPKASNAFKMPEPIGAPHACEIEYAMGNLQLVKDYQWASADFTVSDIMQNYFANFIKTGNPNGKGLAKWEANEGSTNPKKTMFIKESPELKIADREERFRILEKGF